MEDKSSNLGKEKTKLIYTFWTGKDTKSLSKDYHLKQNNYIKDRFKQILSMKNLIFANFKFN